MHETQRGLPAVVFEGRLHSRADAASAAAVARDDPDASVVAAAWRAWGTQAPERLAADFATAVCDTRAGELTLTGDRFGLHGIFYAPSAHGEDAMRAVLPAFLSTLPQAA